MAPEAERLLADVHSGLLPLRLERRSITELPDAIKQLAQTHLSGRLVIVFD